MYYILWCKQVFFSYTYLKFCHHKHGTETFIKKNEFLIKSFFLSLIFHFWLCEVFIVLASFSFCSNRAMNSPHKLGWGVAGDWHFDASFGQSRGLSLFFFFWLCWASFCCTWAFSSCSKKKRVSTYLCAGFSFLWVLLLQSTGFRSQAQYLCCTGLVALRHMVSSQTRDQTQVLCIGG